MFKVVPMIVIGKIHCQMARISGITIFILFSLLLSTQPAHAYLDPGTGSMMLQLLLGGIAGALLVGKMYFRKIKLFFAGVLGRQPQGQDSTDENM